MQGVADPAQEDRSESDAVPVKVRKCSGKRSGPEKGAGGSDRHSAKAVSLRDRRTFGFTQHPYQRSKRVTGAGVLDHGEL